MLSTVGVGSGVGVGEGVGGGGVTSVDGGGVGSGSVSPPLRLMETSAITAMMTAASRIAAKIICHLSLGLPLLAFCCAWAVVGCVLPPSCTLRVPQCGQRLRRMLNCR
ncbi:MAG: hypothetical protein E7444_00030 [Ruminococcaceae bacterium]|nr:hypothetical protein [Oscillospiraceae bacterium]